MGKKQNLGYNPADLFKEVPTQQQNPTNDSLSYNPAQLFSEKQNQSLGEDYNAGLITKQRQDLENYTSDLKEQMKDVDASDAEKEYVVDMALKGAPKEEIESAKLTIQGKHPLQQNEGFFGTKGYYLDDSGKGYKSLIPVNASTKIPEGKNIGSFWGTQEEAEDDNRLTDILKKTANVIPKTAQSLFDLGQAVYGSVTGDEADWYRAVKNTTDALQFKTNSDYDKTLIDTGKFHKFSDFLDIDNYDFSPSTIANTAVNIGQSVLQFALTRGAMGTAGTAEAAAMKTGEITKEVADKAIKVENLAKGFSASYLNNIGTAMEAANNLGVTGQDAYLTALAVTVPVSVVDILGGGEGAINKAFEAQTGKNLISHLIGGAIKDSEGNITKEGLDEMFKTAYAAAETVAKDAPKTLLKTAGEEAGQEVGQNLLDKTSQVIHDNLVTDENRKYGTELFSTQSVAEYLNDALGGLIGGSQGHVTGKILEKKKKEDDKNNTIMSAIQSGNTNELKTQLIAANKNGEISNEDLATGLFKVDRFKEYNEAIADKNLPEEKKKEIFNLTYHKANINEVLTSLESKNVDGINDGLIKEKKEQVKEIENKIQSIWNDTEQEKIKSTEPITSFKQNYKFTSPENEASKPKRKIFGEEEHLNSEEFNQLDNEDKFHYMYDKLTNNNSLGEVQGVLNVSHNTFKGSTYIDIGGHKIELASSDINDRTKDNTPLFAHDKSKVIVKPIESDGRKTLAVYDEDGKQIRNGEGRPYFIRATDKSHGRSKYKVEEAYHESKVLNEFQGTKPNSSFETWNLGELEGQLETPESLKKIDNYTFNPDESVKYGETYNQFAHRVISGYKRLLANSKPNTALVTHSQVIGLIKEWERAGRPSDLSKLNKENIVKENIGQEEIYPTKNDKGQPIYIVRHGDTTENNTVEGTPNKIRSRQVALAPQGKETAIKLGEALKPYNISDVVTSPLKRALETAKIIKKIVHGEYEIETKKPINPKQTVVEQLKVKKENAKKSELENKRQAEIKEAENNSNITPTDKINLINNINEKYDNELNGLEEKPKHQQKPKEYSEKLNKEAIDNIVDYLKKANPKLNIEYDNTIKSAGQVNKDGTIKINPFYAAKDTPIHEVAHIFIDSIGGLENDSIAKSIEQLKDTKLWKETELRYPELNEEMLSKEVLAEAIGIEGADIFEAKTEKNSFIKLLEQIFDKIKDIFGIEKNEIVSLAKIVLKGNIENKTTSMQKQRVMERKFYHGSENEIKEFKNKPIYVSKNIEDAKQYSNNGFVYEVNISDKDIENEDDFGYFDSGAINPNSWDANVVFNPESGYAFIKNPHEMIFNKIQFEPTYEQRIKEEIKHFKSKPVSVKKMAYVRFGVSLEKLQEEKEKLADDTSEEATNRLKEIENLEKDIDNEYTEYLSNLKNIQEILEHPDIENKTESELMDMYKHLIQYDDTMKSDVFKDIMYRIAKTLSDKQTGFLKSKGVDVDAIKGKDLRDKDRLLKVLSHMTEAFPELQQLSKLWDKAYDSYFEEKQNLSTELNNLAKNVVSEERKKQGLTTKTKDLLTGDNSKYFSWMEKDGKLITTEQAKGLSEEKQKYLEKYKETIEHFKIEQDEASELYQENALIKTDKGFKETYKDDGLLAAVQNWVGNSKIDEIKMFYGDNKTLKTLAEINEDIRTRAKQGIISQAIAATKSLYYSLKAQRLLVKRENEDSSKLPESFYRENFINRRGQITNQYQSKEGKKNYSKDFHAAILDYVNDMSYTKNVAKILPYVKSIEYFNSINLGKNSNIVKWIKYWQAKHIFKEQKKSAFPELDLVLKLLRNATSLTAMTFNMKAGLWNAAIGNYNSFISQGGKKYAVGTKRLIAKKGEGYVISSKARKFLEKNGVVSLQQEEDLKPYVGKSFAFIARMFSTLGEFQVQATQFLGQMSKEDWNKIDKEGNYTGEDKEAFKERVSKYKNKVSDIQGKYSDKDRRNFELWEVGRFMGQFKTWMPDWIKERFGDKYYTLDGEVHYGRYRAFQEFALKELRQDIANGKMFTSDEYKYVRMRQNLKGALITASLLAMSLGADDDDKKRRKGDALSQATNNLLVIFSPSQLKFMITTPAAGIKTAADWFDTFYDAITLKEFSKDSKYGNKGTLEAPIEIAKLLPYHNLILNDYIIPDKK